MVINTPSNNELMLLTRDKYCAISYATIQAALEEITMKSFPSPTKGITTYVTQPNTHATQGSAVQMRQNATSTNSCSHIIPNLICTVDFIRYTNFLLNSTEDILKFYSDVQTQGMQYNVVLRHIDDIQPYDTLFPSDLPAQSIALISTTLFNKFRQQKVVAKDYSIGQNLLKATTDGFIFLKQILMIKLQNSPTLHQVLVKFTSIQLSKIFIFMHEPSRITLVYRGLKGACMMQKKCRYYS